MKARIRITLKNGVLDPQGKAIQNALGALGFDGVDEVRQGKYIEVDLVEADEAKEFGIIDEVFDRRPEAGEGDTTGAADITPA
mgnify:CR=1 FL=1